MTPTDGDALQYSYRNIRKQNPSDVLFISVLKQGFFIYVESWNRRADIRERVM